jgi:hypothetical protein
MPLGVKCTPPFLCVRALASFKPLEAHICSLGAHLCPLGLNYALWGSFMPPRGQVRAPPSYVCTPWHLLSPLRLIYVP